MKGTWLMLYLNAFFLSFLLNRTILTAIPPCLLLPHYLVVGRFHFLNFFFLLFKGTVSPFFDLF
jgi:hypothetical protein